MLTHNHHNLILGDMVIVLISEQTVFIRWMIYCFSFAAGLVQSWRERSHPSVHLSHAHQCQLLFLPTRVKIFVSLLLFNRWLHDVHKLFYDHITFANKGIEKLPSNFPSTHFIIKFTQHLHFRNHDLFSGTESEWTQSVNLCVWFSVCRAAPTCWWTPVSGRNGWWMAYWWLPWTNTEKSAPSSPVVESCY